MQPWGCSRARDNFGSLRPLPEKTTCSFPYRFSGKSRNSGLVPGNRDPKSFRNFVRNWGAQNSPGNKALSWGITFQNHAFCKIQYFRMCWLSNVFDKTYYLRPITGTEALLIVENAFNCNGSPCGFNCWVCRRAPKKWPKYRTPVRVTYYENNSFHAPYLLDLPHTWNPL